MAKFLDTRGCAAALSDLLKFSTSPLTLISPYLQLSSDFKEALTYRNKQGSRTTLVIRKPELNPDDLAHLEELRLVTLRWHKDLHAKSYFDHDKMIITSMNLYQFSMDNNKEMGVMIEKNNPADTQVFGDAMREIQYILDASQPYQLRRPSLTTPPVPNDKKSKAGKKATGYCIRTGVEIPFNVDKPLCREAYNIWSEFANGDYPEKYCHFSGEPSHGETSVDKPILRKHWRKAQELHGI